MFVEVGPKKALQGFAADVLGDEVVALATNHPKLGDTTAFNQALCGSYAGSASACGQVDADRRWRLASDRLRRRTPASVVAGKRLPRPTEPVRRRAHSTAEPVVITGAALGLPGAPRLFDDGNVARILHGEQGIDVIPTRIRHEMLDKHITRLVKGEGGARFETIDSPADVIKLAGRAGEFDLGDEFGIDADRIPALGRETQLAIARRHRRAARRRHPARPPLPDDQRRHASCPTGGCSPTSCATAPASSSPRPSPASTTSPTS